MRKFFLNIFFVIMFVFSIHYLLAQDSQLKNNKNNISIANKIKCLKRAYNPYIYSVFTDNKKNVYFRMSDGSVIPWDGQRRSKFHLEDMMAQSYPPNLTKDPYPGITDDPGYYHDKRLFNAIYGKDKSAVEKNLIKVRWMPKTLKSPPVYILFNKHNGAAAALQRVSNELDKLPDNYKKYVLHPSGTFKWRLIAELPRRSLHSYGIAIDINEHYSNYWLYDVKHYARRKFHRYHNNIPDQIIRIFESNGFMWGGRWYDYDTMHFEYRPELFIKTCQ